MQRNSKPGEPAMTTATYKIANKGNTAIQCEVWQVPIEAAKKLSKEMRANGQAGPGSYWENNFVRPVRRAVRAKAAFVGIRTAGFSTGEFANRLRCVDCEIEYAGEI